MMLGIAASSSMRHANRPADRGRGQLDEEERDRQAQGHGDAAARSASRRASRRCCSARRTPRSPGSTRSTRGSPRRTRERRGSELPRERRHQQEQAARRTDNAHEHRRGPEDAVRGGRRGSRRSLRATRPSRPERTSPFQVASTRSITLGRERDVVQLLGLRGAVARSTSRRRRASPWRARGVVLLLLDEDEGGAGDRPAPLARLVGEHQRRSPARPSSRRRPRPPGTTRSRAATYLPGAVAQLARSRSCSARRRRTRRTRSTRPPAGRRPPRPRCPCRRRRPARRRPSRCRPCSCHSGETLSR